MPAATLSNAISVGPDAVRPMDSAVFLGITELPLGDPRAITLLPGQEVWRWETLLILPFFTIIYPVLISNEDGVLVKYVLGIHRKR